MTRRPILYWAAWSSLSLVAVTAVADTPGKTGHEPSQTENGPVEVPVSGYECAAGKNFSAAASGIMLACASTCINNTAMFIGCDDRIQGPTTANAADSGPWNSVGHFIDDGASGIGSCTGTLIGSKHVLTAAHCVLNSSGDFRNGPIAFRLGQFSAGPCGQPYGTHYAVRVFIPKDMSGDLPESKASDWAVVELANEIPGAKKMVFEYLPWTTVENKSPLSVGYPVDKPVGTVWSTGTGNSFINGPYEWLDFGDKGLFYVTNDGFGGQSGSPIYVFHEDVRKLVGVFLGSPVEECLLGRTWATRITPGTEQRIRNAKQYPPNGNVLDFSLRRRDIPPAQILANVPRAAGCGF